ncbi:hypothetical protein BGZ73_008234 [Actinomortierella ambigua]|nr:hypothetical protein BGZ73_008234 [Actinomortierella ambigua]
MRILGSSSVWSLGMKALAITQIAGGVVQDDTSETGPSSLIRTGEDMLAYVRMNNLDLGYCLAAMVATVVGYRLLVWVSLIVKVKREKW